MTAMDKLKALQSTEPVLAAIVPATAPPPPAGNLMTTAAPANLNRSSPSESLDGSDATTDGGTHGHSTAVPLTDDILTTFAFFNIRGLKPRTTLSKVTAISDLLFESTQLFMGLSETWLCNHVDVELHIKGYSLHRQDCVLRRSNRGRDSGGVAIYVRDDAATITEVIFNFSNGAIEALGIHIEDWNLVVFIVYRSPDNNWQKSAFNEFSQLVKSMNQCLRHLPTPDVILGGDLNLSNADWDSGECPGSNRIREELKMV